MDRDGKHLYVNPEFTAITGYTLEDIPTGKDWQHKAYPDKAYRQKVTALWKDDRREGVTTRVVSVVCKDGETKEIEFRPTILEDGRAVVMLTDVTERERAEEVLQRHREHLEELVTERTAALQATNAQLQREITERKQIEKELRESEKKYRELINGMHDTAWVIDFEGKFIDVNDAAVEVLGYSREELLTMGPHDIDSSLDAKKITGLIKGMQTDKLQVFETTHTSKDGKTIPVEIKSSLVMYQGEQAILSIARDITERKVMEEELRKGEERFRSVVETMKVGLGAIDENGVLTYVNEYFSKMLGYTIDEMIGRSTLDFYYDEESRKTQEEIFAKRREGMRDPTPYEVTWRKKDGLKVYSILSPSPSFDADGRFIGSFAIHTDITERKQTEEALQRSYEQLQETLITTVNALTSMVEMKDRYTAGHQPRVAQLACALAEAMGLSEEQIEGIRMAGFVHDIGKINIPAEILSKPGQLTEIQYDMVKMHPQASYEILKGIKFPWAVAEIALQHHERMDGSGYPQGLPGKEILLEARILAVANVVEAMTSHRPYRPAHDIKEALQEISQKKDVFYDPDVVDACLKLFTEKRFSFD